jgi:hypothetical protein
MSRVLVCLDAGSLGLVEHLLLKAHLFLDLGFDLFRVEVVVFVLDVLKQRSRDRKLFHRFRLTFGV